MVQQSTVYEVNLRIDNAIAEDFAVWLRGHIRDMLALDGFVRAIWYLEKSEGEEQLWCVRYHVDSEDLLQRYLESDASEMRREAIRRFGRRFSASRRVLLEREIFT